MFFKVTFGSFALMAFSAPAVAPVPKEIDACAKWTRSNTQTPSSFVLRGYSGYGRIVSAEQLSRNIMGQYKAMTDPSNGTACVYMATVTYDVQNTYGAIVRDTSTCTVLVRDGNSPSVEITLNGDRAAWRDFATNTQKCSRPTLFKADE